MRFKLLIVPSFVIVSLVLAIGYVQPAIVEVQEQRFQIADKEKEVANIDAAILSVKTLEASLGAQKETEQFVMKYFPNTLDQGTVVNALNHYAAQSGVIFSELEMKEIIEASRLESLADLSAPLVSGAGALRQGDLRQSEASPGAFTVKSYAVKAKVKGSYENIKSFFDRVSASDRLFRLRLYNVSADRDGTAAQGAGAATVGSSELAGTFSAYFDYLPKTPMIEMLMAKTFAKSQFDFTPARSAMRQANDTPPTMERGDTGRPNPFQ